MIRIMPSAFCVYDGLESPRLPIIFKNLPMEVYDMFIITLISWQACSIMSLTKVGSISRIKSVVVWMSEGLLQVHCRGKGDGEFACQSGAERSMGAGRLFTNYGQGCWLRLPFQYRHSPKSEMHQLVAMAIVY